MITLTQRVSLSSRKRQEILSDFCADFRLNENKQIEYNQISCQEKRKPLCMAGKPADGSANSINVVQTSKRFKKKRKMKKQKKIKLREWFIKKSFKALKSTPPHYAIAFKILMNPPLVERSRKELMH